MHTFDIHKNFIAVLGALALALTLIGAHPVDAADANQATAQTVAPPTKTEGAKNEGLCDLRTLLSTPERSPQENLKLLRALDDMGEEVADATAEPSASQSSFVRTVNELLGVKTPNDATESSHS